MIQRKTIEIPVAVVTTTPAWLTRFCPRTLKIVRPQRAVRSRAVGMSGLPPRA